MVDFRCEEPKSPFVFQKITSQKEMFLLFAGAKNLCSILKMVQLKNLRHTPRIRNAIKIPLIFHGYSEFLNENTTLPQQITLCKEFNPLAYLIPE
jgi:hypothetical protein